MPSISPTIKQKHMNFSQSGFAPPKYVVTFDYVGVISRPPGILVSVFDSECYD